MAGNLGEIAAGSAGSGPGCVPVRDSVRRATAVAEGRRRRPGAAGVSDAHAHAGAGDLRGRTQQREKTRARMMVTTRLARKDTVWYLCAVLQRVLPAVALPSGSGCRSHCDAASGSGCGSGLDCDAVSPVATATTTATLAGNTASPLSAPNTPQFAIDTGPGTHTNADTKTAIERAAEQAVYDALADLLRRTRRTLSNRTRALASASGFHQPRRPSVCTRPGSSSRSGFGSGEASNHGRPAPASTSSLAFAAEGRASEAELSEGLLVSAATGSGSGESTSTGAGTGRTDADAGGSGGSAEISVPWDWRGHMRAGSTTRSAGKGPALQAERERIREGQEAMGEVERGMLLAVLERTWLGVC